MTKLWASIPLFSCSEQSSLLWRPDDEGVWGQWEHSLSCSLHWSHQLQVFFLPLLKTSLIGCFFLMGNSGNTSYQKFRTLLTFTIKLGILCSYTKTLVHKYELVHFNMSVRKFVSSFPESSIACLVNIVLIVTGLSLLVNVSYNPKRTNLLF